MSEQLRKKRVSKQDWLDEALTVLRQSGIEGLRVENLAKRLGVAKSGFYYHFRDLEQFKSLLLDHWLKKDGMPQELQAKLIKPSPRELLINTVETIFQNKLSQLDLALRQWSQSDPDVNAVYQREVLGRVAHIRGIFKEAGFEGDELEMRTKTFVVYASAEAHYFDHLSSDELGALWKLRLDMLLAKD